MKTVGFWDFWFRGWVDGGGGGPFDYRVGQRPNPWDLRLKTLDLDSLRPQTWDFGFGLRLDNSMITVSVSIVFMKFRLYL